MDYLNEIIRGRELVIISANPKDDSAVFYADRDGNVYSWCKEIGSYRHKDRDRLVKHFKAMEAEGSILVLRGVPFAER